LSLENSGRRFAICSNISSRWTIRQAGNIVCFDHMTKYRVFILKVRYKLEHVCHHSTTPHIHRPHPPAIKTCLPLLLPITNALCNQLPPSPVVSHNIPPQALSPTEISLHIRISPKFNFASYLRRTHLAFISQSAFHTWVDEARRGAEECAATAYMSVRLS
jgi:hypothetical protein